MTKKEEILIKKMAEESKKDDKHLEAYKSLSALYIQVDESVMTRHKFFLTIIIAIFTAIGFLTYQLDICNYNKTLLLIDIALFLGVSICFSWLFISFRGLYIDEILSRELEHVEYDIYKDKVDIYRAFTIYNKALTTDEGIKDPKTKKKILIPKWCQSFRMENISIFITRICLIIFVGFLYYILHGDIKNDLHLNNECTANIKAQKIGDIPQSLNYNLNKYEDNKLQLNTSNNQIKYLPTNNATKAALSKCNDECIKNLLKK